jgi:hypothetical protein
MTKAKLIEKNKQLREHVSFWIKKYADARMQYLECQDKLWFKSVAEVVRKKYTKGKKK